MNSEEVYKWYLKNGEFDYELISTMQLECFNKPIEPVKKISYHELGSMLSSDKRFNDSRLALRWWIITDMEYTVVSNNLIRNLIAELNEVPNPWTVLAIIQSATVTNCAGVGGGYRIVNDEIDTSDHVEVVVFITDIGLIVYKHNGSEWVEVKEGEVVIGTVVFD